MKFNELELTRKKSAKRAGRGIAAGRGKTAGRGTKGQRSRTGSGRKPGFEGGQNPLMQRLPKLPGFRSHKPAAVNVYTGQLDAFGAKKITNDSLAEAGLIPHAYSTVKLVVKGDVTKKLTVELQSASATAIAAIENAGGSFTKVARQSRQVTSAKKLERAEKATK
jgi:large subunit ribosomal protein L15